MTKIIYGGLIKDRLNISRKEDAIRKKLNENLLVANAIAKTKKTTREAKPIIYGDLYNKRIKESEKEDIIKKQLEQLSYSVRDGRRQAEHQPREGVIMPGQVANRTPPISAITKEMIDEYHEAEKLKPVIIDGEIRKYEKALYEPNLDFSDLQTTDQLENLTKVYQDENRVFAEEMSNIDNELIATDENIKRIKNEIDEKGSNVSRLWKMQQEIGRKEKLKEDYKKLQKDMDLSNIRIRNMKDAYDNIKKHNAEVSLRNRDEVLKYEQSLNLINRNRLNLQQQPNESEYEYYNRLREIERTKYDPVLYKQYAENEQTKTLKTHLNSLFDNTTFKEEVLSHISPTDKFIINKHFDEIEKVFLDKFGYNNKSINPKTTADALLLLSNKYKTEATTTLQSAIKRLASQKVLKGKQQEAKRADEINQQIQDREHRILAREERANAKRAIELNQQIQEREQRLSAREAKALERQLRKEYEQTQETDARNIERNRLLEVNRGIANERARQRQAEKREQINERAQRISAREAKALEKQLRKEYEQTQEEAQKTEARGKIGEMIEARANKKLYKNTMKKVKGYENLQRLQKQQAFNDLLSTLQEHKDWKFFKSLAKPADVEHTRLPSGISPLQEAENKRIDELINQSIEKQEEEEKKERKPRSDKGIPRGRYNTRARTQQEEREGKGLRGRIHPKKRIVKVSKKDLLRNRLFLITSEIKAGNDNPKLIIEMDKLYKQLYGIDNAHLHFKK